MAILEACVETLEEARAAEAGGASRIELCANLAEQGTTPEESVTAACVAALGIPVFVMVRPRPGDFAYSVREAAEMRRQVVRAKSLGAAGIVTGALAPDRTLDEEAMRALIDAAGSLPVTCHRAFDGARDREAALEMLISIGAARVLTSGGAATATQGADTIAHLVRLAAGRMVVMAGGGVRAHDVRDLVARTGVAEVHAHLTTSADVGALVANLHMISAG